MANRLTAKTVALPVEERRDHHPPMIHTTTILQNHVAQAAIDDAEVGPDVVDSLRVG